jgi:phosphatidate cytidylyltransferase
MSLSNLALRSITGFFFGAVIITSCFLPLIFQVVLYAILMSIALREYIQFFKSSNSLSIDKASAHFLQLLVFFIVSSPLLISIQLHLIWVIVPIFFLVIINELWRNVENPMVNISLLLFGILYTMLPFYLIISLGNLSLDYSVVFPLTLGMYILIWTNDTFAYFSGRLFGKQPLFSRISPKKTWEGTFGGILFTLIMGGILYLLTQELSLLFWLVSAAIVAPTAILGDLLESLFKRSADVKDSGNILPGHGGVLDRFDAVLFTVPFYYFWSLFYLQYIAA